MGLVYFRVSDEVLHSLQLQIDAHEAEPVGPRARGYWLDRPEKYDYDGVRQTAQTLDQAGRVHAMAILELSEVQAHALSMLELELRNDGKVYDPSPFASSADNQRLRYILKTVRRRLGSDPEQVASALLVDEDNVRVADFMRKQLRHLREALLLVWPFYQAASEAGDAILVVDLRARDLETPDIIELTAID